MAGSIGALGNVGALLGGGGGGALGGLGGALGGLGGAPQPGIQGIGGMPLTGSQFDISGLEAQRSDLVKAALANPYDTNSLQLALNQI
ncbi:MAG: hypothetical protein K2X66_00155, partial [Cyanobacteria bacterium]|nr:hypothetical protein [Cyanobacteriota bacterium]